MATIGKDVRSLLRSRVAFGKLSAKELENQRKALRYIELIAMQANINISSWDIKKAFRNGASKKLLTDPKEINKRLFAMHANTKDQDKQLALLDVYENAEKLKNLKTDVDPEYVNSMNADMKHFQEALEIKKKALDFGGVKYCEERIRQYKKAIKQCDATINAYEDTLRLVNDGFWRLYDVNVSEGIIRFITANNIVLFDKNPKTKLNLHKDMGQYTVCVNVSRHNLHAYADVFKNNTTLGDGDSDEYIHPYISGGSICLGNASNSFDKAVKKKDLYTAMTIVGSALSTYNSGNGPYITLYQFTKKTNSDLELCTVKDTVESKEYDARKKKQLLTLDARLAELALVIPAPVVNKKVKVNVKKVKNTLAKAMGKAPQRLERITHDDENDDDLVEEMYEEENDDEGYF